MTGKEIWCEKYRPKKLDNIYCNGNELELIKALVRSGKHLPHLLLYGIEGTGKSTIAKAILREVLGKNWKFNSIEINASLKTSIETVRQDIVTFGRQATITGSPFKIILLEEYDNASKPNQQALRKVMEDFAKNNRFILTANYINKVIEPIQSRCAIYHIHPLKKEQVIERLKYIAKKEGVKISEKALNKIAKSSRGRLRNAINLLAKFSVLDRPIKLQDVSRDLENSEINSFLKTVLIERNITSAISEMIRIFEEKGLTEAEFIENVLNKSMQKKFPGSIKSKIAQICANSSYQIALGSPPEVAVYGFLGKLFDLGSKLKRKKKEK